MEKEKITRAKAFEAGLISYSSGKTCPLHPDSERYTSSACCVQCTIEKSRVQKKDFLAKLASKKAARKNSNSEENLLKAS
jgi:hypothetical protein